MGGTSDSKKNELANRIVQTKSTMAQLENLINEDATGKLVAEYQKAVTELQEQETEISLQTQQKQALLTTKTNKTKQLKDLVPANALLTQDILPAIQSMEIKPGMELPVADVLLQSTETAITLIDQICNKPVETNPLGKPQIYRDKQDLLDKVKNELEREVNTKADVKLILQNIDKFPELLANKPNSPGGFILFLTLIKRNTHDWEDFQARHQSNFRSDPTAEEYKALLTPLQQAIEDEKKDVADFLQATSQNEEKINTSNTAIQTLQQIKTTLLANTESKLQLETELNTLESNISKQSETIDTLTLESQQKTLEKNNLKAQMQAITNSGNQILDDLLGVFNSQPKLKPAEGKSTHEEKKHKLTAINEALDTLPTDDELQQLVDQVTPFDESKSMSAKFTSYLEAKKNALGQLETNRLANERLLARIYGREELVIEFRQKLEDYLENRNRRYAITLSIDGKLRTAFIEILLKKLDTYHLTGDKTPVIKAITTHISKFPGNNLQAILNKITIDLLDFDQQIPASFTDLPADAENLVTLHDNALGLITNLTDEQPKYVQDITNLYEQINHMRDYGTKLTEVNASCGVEVNKLADQLQADVDHFVLAHVSLPTKESYANFKIQFTARLHSQDDAMNKHREAWKPILGNILIGVITLGVAIGVQLAYSKLSTGRAAFFFDETARQGKIQSVDKSLQQLEDTQWAAPVSP